MNPVVKKILTPIVRCLYPIGSVRKVLRGPCKGTLFTVRQGVGFYYALGLDPLFSWWEAQIVPGMIIYDVGANQGQCSLLFGRLVGSQGAVISFEPAKNPFYDLKNNINRNAFPHIVAFNYALSDKSAEVEFEYNDSFPTQGKLKGVEESYKVSEASTYIVKTVTLDSIVSVLPFPPNWIKIDVEGALAKVLKGASFCLANFNPKIYIELHGIEEQNAVVTELINKGFQAYSLDGTVIKDVVSNWISPLVVQKT